MSPLTRPQTMTAETKEGIVAMVAAMSTEKRERWMKRNGFTGMAAVALMRRVRVVWFKEAGAKLKAEMETPAFRAALSKEAL